MGRNLPPRSLVPLAKRAYHDWLGRQATGFQTTSMDVATHLLQWKEQPPEEWARAANRFLPPIVSALLILALAYKLAELTWALFPGISADDPPPVVNTPVAQAGSAPQTGIDLSGISEASLFGVASAEPPPVDDSVVDAPETNLNLELRGIVASNDDKAGWAIIADGRGLEKTYFVGETIDNAGGTVLHSVYGNRVILNRAGNLETLSLPKELSSSPVTIAARPQVAQPAAPASSLQQVISQNASRITDILRVVPHIEQGQMVGFRLNPGESREQFDALGLLPGDVVTDINGTALTDPSRGLLVFEALGEATMANVTVIRNGQPEVLAIDTS
ncbi:MAG: type II secretion system protein GspC [Gammaproteobacteria bacterium]